MPFSWKHFHAIAVEFLEFFWFRLHFSLRSTLYYRVEEVLDGWSEKHNEMNENVFTKLSYLLPRYWRCSWSIIAVVGHDAFQEKTRQFDTVYTNRCLWSQAQPWCMILFRFRQLYSITLYEVNRSFCHRLCSFILLGSQSFYPAPPVIRGELVRMRM